MRRCPRCKTEKPLTDFYSRRKKIGNSVYCKPCTIEQTIDRQRNFKQQCVDYKGGKCEKCGYSKYAGALEFHHKDPSEKDFTLAHVKLTSFSENIKKELDKCVLLCSNCHRERHAEIKGLI